MSFVLSRCTEIHTVYEGVKNFLPELRTLVFHLGEIRCQRSSDNADKILLRKGCSFLMGVDDVTFLPLPFKPLKFCRQIKPLLSL